MSAGFDKSFRESHELKTFRSEWFSEISYVKALTSGSTGKAKQIRLDKSAMRNSARRTMTYFGLDSGSRLYSCVSPKYIGGKMMAVRGWEYNAKVEFEVPSNTPLCNKKFGETEVIDLISVVPSQLLWIIGHPEISCRLKRILVGGAPLSDSLRMQVREAGLNVWESYGMTETCSHIALRKVEYPSRPFEPLPGIRIGVNDEGCLWINIGDIEVQTNDIALINSDGSFEICGRLDNVIISGAKKIHPEKVERLLAAFLKEKFGIAENAFAITSRPDTKWGQRCVLAVADVPLSSDNANKGSAFAITLPEVAAIRDSGLIEPWECPKEVIKVKSIPTTPNGKTDRNALTSLIRLAES